MMMMIRKRMYPSAYLHYQYKKLNYNNPIKIYELTTTKIYFIISILIIIIMTMTMKKTSNMMIMMNNMKRKTPRSSSLFLFQDHYFFSSFVYHWNMMTILPNLLFVDAWLSSSSTIRKIRTTSSSSFSSSSSLKRFDHHNHRNIFNNNEINFNSKHSFSSIKSSSSSSLYSPSVNDNDNRDDIEKSMISLQQQQQPNDKSIIKNNNKWNNNISTNNDDNNDNDTIYALSSNSGQQQQATAVAVIRISGPLSKYVLEHLLLIHDDDHPNYQKTMNHFNKKNNKIKQQVVPKSRYASVRTLYDWETFQVLDQSALILWFPGPNSFTGEDIVEIHCHGNSIIISNIINTLQKPIWILQQQQQQSNNNIYKQYQCRYAERGEFANRAYIYGKLDLLQIEALSDILCADTTTQLQLAFKQLDKSLSNLYDEWRIILLSSLAHAEAIIDFGDDDTITLIENDDYDDDNDGINHDQQKQQVAVWGNVIDKIQLLKNDMKGHLHDYQKGELIRNGLMISIIGPPNCGKSSLLNILAKRDAAIVSNIPGTTRDIIEIPYQLNGIKCIIQDTAGIRRNVISTSTPSSPSAQSTSYNNNIDVIEQEGIKRSMNAAKQSDLLIGMIDCTTNETIYNGLQTLYHVLNEMMIENNNNNIEKTLHEEDDDDHNKYQSNQNNDANDDTVIVSPRNFIMLFNKADWKEKTMKGTTKGEQIEQRNNQEDQIVWNNIYEIWQNVKHDTDRSKNKKESSSSSSSSSSMIVLDNLFQNHQNHLPLMDDVDITKTKNKKMNDQYHYHFISCLTQSGIDSFLHDLTYLASRRVGIQYPSHHDNDSDPSLLNNDDDDNDDRHDSALITRARHRHHIQNCVYALEQFLLLTSSSSSSTSILMNVDIAAEELRLASSEIGRVIGTIDVEDILDQLFKDFCIGK